ncbi:MAG: hypothetical protein M3Q48_04835 [Actinomycetota bacterium]|nr:hypothetical protein [Actinomycetota bacterium]
MGIMLLTVALALQFVLPISTSPENSAGSCGRLLESQQKEADDDRNLWVLLFEEQRLEAVCDDARTARRAYVGLTSGAILLGSVRLRRRTPHRTVRFILIGVGLLLALAAVTDGPIVLLLGSAAGVLLLAAPTTQQTEPAAGPARDGHRGSAPG